ncbi:MAG: hypothetical protein ABIH82_05295 [Candidatus Woesearchaeota archaeon]
MNDGSCLGQKVEISLMNQLKQNVSSVQGILRHLGDTDLTLETHPNNLIIQYSGTIIPYSIIGGCYIVDK